MTTRFRASALAGVTLLALCALAAPGCGTLPTQPNAEAAGATSARLIEPIAEPEDDTTEELGANVETPTQTPDRPGRGPKHPKKPKPNP